MCIVVVLLTFGTGTFAVVLVISTLVDLIFSICMYLYFSKTFIERAWEVIENNECINRISQIAAGVKLWYPGNSVLNKYSGVRNFQGMKTLSCFQKGNIFGIVWCRVAEVVRRHEGPSPKTMDIDELHFFFGNFWTKKYLFWWKTGHLWQRFDLAA